METIEYEPIELAAESIEQGRNDKDCLLVEAAALEELEEYNRAREREECQAIEREARIMARALEMREEKAVAANRERSKKEPPHEMNQDYRKRIAGYTKGKNIIEIERLVLFLINNASDKAAAQALRGYYNNYVIAKPQGGKIISISQWFEIWSGAIGYTLHRTQGNLP